MRKFIFSVLFFLLSSIYYLSSNIEFALAGGGGALGKITPPDGIPTVTGDPSGFVGKIIQNGLTILITVAFVIALVWTMIAGIRFITAGSDPKTISSAWSQIYWGIIGLVVVLGSFAIINIVQTFFGVQILNNFQIPGL